jgi:hypothetical protein
MVTTNLSTPYTTVTQLSQRLEHHREAEDVEDDFQMLSHQYEKFSLDYFNKIQ